MNKRLKLVVSDFHLGPGKYNSDGSVNSLEDFHHDLRFAEFLEYYCKGEYENAEIELVFNGDMLNLIMTDYHGHFTVVITESVSTHKLKKIIDGHPVFFESLRKFLSHTNRSLTFVVGNHDQEMLWKGTRAIFEEAVGREVTWKNTHHLVDGVYIEHGHQYEAVNRFDPTLPFLTEGHQEPILNLPWGTLFTIQFIVRLKQRRPAIDKVRPFKQLIWWCLIHDTWMAIGSLCRLALYFMSTRLTKNRNRQTSLRTTMKIIREASVFPDLSDAAKRILRSPEIHTVIFGHSHVYKQVNVGPHKQYLNTGTWNDITSLDLETYARRTKLTYARIEYTGDTLHPTRADLRHWIGRIPMEDDAFSL